MAKIVFFIGGGHGPNTPGKRSPDGSYREFMFNKPTAERLGALLQTYENTEVHYLHDTAGKIDVPLSTRINKANAYYKEHEKDIKAGKIIVVYISIHTNAAGSGWSSARGSETWIYKGAADSKKIAAKIESEVKKITGLKSRGVKESTVLDEVQLTKMPAVIHEAAFHTNKDDVALLKTRLFVERVAVGLENAMADLYALKRKAAKAQTPAKPATPQKPPAAPKTPTKAPGGLWYVQAGAFSTEAAAEAQKKKLEKAGFKAIVKK